MFHLTTTIFTTSSITTLGKSMSSILVYGKPWLSTLVKNYPALSMPDNYADPTKFQLPIALGKVLIASSELILCADFQDCTWSSYGDNFPGPDRPPSVPVIPTPPSPACESGMP